MSKTIVRLQLNLSPETDQMLEEVAQAEHLSKSGVLKKAIALVKYVADTKKAGKKICVVDRHNKLAEIAGL